MDVCALAGSFFNTEAEWHYFAFGLFIAAFIVLLILIART